MNHPPTSSSLGDPRVCALLRLVSVSGDPTIASRLSGALPALPQGGLN